MPDCSVHCPSFVVTKLSREDQGKIKDSLLELISRVIVAMAPTPDLFDKLKRLFGENGGIERALNFTSSIVTLANVLGSQPPTRLGDWANPELPRYALKRERPWDFGLKARPSRKSTSENVTPEDAEARERDEISHKKMGVFSVINMRLWDEAEWYLHRRAALERTFEIVGDELDLLAFYLAGGRWPADDKTKVNLVGCSRQLDGYLRRRDLGLSKVIPKLKLNLWWKDILERIETKPFRGWTEAAIILLSFPLKHQDDYRNLVESTLVEMSISPQHIVGRDILLAVYPTALEMVGLATYISTRGSREEHRQKVMRALEHLGDMVPNPDCGVAILVFPDSYPYNCLAMAS